MAFDGLFHQMEKMKPRDNPSCENCQYRGKSLFGTLCADDLAQLKPHKKLRHYRRRELLFGQGNVPEACSASPPGR